MPRFQAGSRYAERTRVVVTIEVTILCSNVVTVVAAHVGDTSRTMRKSDPLDLEEGNVLGNVGLRESASYEAEALALGGAPGPLITRLSELKECSARFK